MNEQTAKTSSERGQEGLVKSIMDPLRQGTEGLVKTVQETVGLGGGLPKGDVPPGEQVCIEFVYCLFDSVQETVAR